MNKLNKSTTFPSLTLWVTDSEAGYWRYPPSGCHVIGIATIVLSRLGPLSIGIYPYAFVGSIPPRSTFISITTNFLSMKGEVWRLPRPGRWNCPALGRRGSKATGLLILLGTFSPEFPICSFNSCVIRKRFNFLTTLTKNILRSMREISFLWSHHHKSRFVNLIGYNLCVMIE